MPFQIMASQSKDKPRDTTLTTVSEIKYNTQTLIINTLIHFVLVILTYSGKNMTDINKVDFINFGYIENFKDFIHKSSKLNK